VRGSLANDHEPASLEYSDRAAVVLRDVRVERTRRLDPQELAERTRRNALAPELATDPVADESQVPFLPAQEVARDLSVPDDRSCEPRVVGEDPRPMRDVGIPVAGGNGGHAGRLGVELVLEEDEHVFVRDLA